MSDNSDDIKPDLSKFKPKKKALAVPKEFLENANSYDEKLVVVKVFAEKNVQNTVKLFKLLGTLKMFSRILTTNSIVNLKIILQPWLNVISSSRRKIE